MARASVLGVGEAGLVLDTKPHLLPPNVWSGGRNIRFDRNKVFTMGGVSEFKTGLTDVFSVGLAIGTLARYTVYSSEGRIYVNDGTTETEITQDTPYSEDADNPFNYFMYNGYLLAHNALNITQVWNPTSIANDLEDLPNWDSTFLAKILKPFGPFLMALDINEDGTLYPHKIRWGSPAEPGALPSTWDETDATNEAGEYSFSDTDKGTPQNALELGNRFYIYKRGSIHMLEYIGGQDVFGRVLLPSEVGLEYPRSLVNVPHQDGAMQFFAGQDSFYLMDGIRTIPLFMEIFQREFLQLVDTQYAKRSFAVINRVNNELWFCFPERGEQYPTLAFCWRYHNNTYSIKELSGTTSIASGLGITDESQSVIQPLTFSDGTFFSDGTGFADEALVYTIPSIVEAGTKEGKVYNLERGMLGYDGNPLVCYVERIGISAIGSKPGQEQEYRKRKLAKAVVPKLYSGSAVLQVGMQEREQQSVTWGPEYVINPDIYKLYLTEPISGRFLAFRWSNLPGAPFELGGFDYDISLLGEY